MEESRNGRSFKNQVLRRKCKRRREKGRRGKCDGWSGGSARGKKGIEKVEMEEGGGRGGAYDVSKESHIK